MRKKSHINYSKELSPREIEIGKKLLKEGLSPFQIGHLINKPKAFPKGGCNFCKKYRYLSFIDGHWLCERCYNKEFKKLSNPSRRDSIWDGIKVE